MTAVEEWKMQIREDIERINSECYRVLKRFRERCWEAETMEEVRAIEDQMRVISETRSSRIEPLRRELDHIIGAQVRIYNLRPLHHFIETPPT